MESRSVFAYSIYVPIFFYIFYSYADYPKCFIAMAWKQTDVFHFTVSSNLLSFVIFQCDIQLHASYSRARAIKISLIIVLVPTFLSALNLFTKDTHFFCLLIYIALTISINISIKIYLSLPLRVYAHSYSNEIQDNKMIFFSISCLTFCSRSRGNPCIHVGGWVHAIVT